MKSVVLFFRKPVPHFFSIEKIFNSVAEKLQQEVNVKKSILPFYTSSIKKILANLSYARKQKGDVYHVTGDVHYVVLALKKNRTILTIHDCIFLFQYTGVKRWFFFHLFLNLPVKRCRVITTISEQSKKDIIKYSGCQPEKIRVINNPVPEAMYFKEKKFNSEKPVILFLGSTPNKNLPRCIEALKGISCELVIVGVVPEAEQQKLKENNISYSTSSKLTESELADKYAECDLLLFPTTFEGFGLPIVEAQRAGRPVLTSDLSPMKEVAGEGACLVDPYSEQSIRQGLEKIIFDEGYRKNLVEKGFLNVERFDPQAIAEQYLQLYREVAEN